MRGSQELCSLSAAEGSRQRAMERCNTQSQEKEPSREDINNRSSTCNEIATPLSSQPLKPGKQAKRSAPFNSAPYLQPLPTIETIMTYPSISRPVYDSLLRGDPPAQTYKTVIHTPKPTNIQVMDQNLLRAAEFQVYRRHKRSRSNTVSTNTSWSSMDDGSTASSKASSIADDSDTSASDASEPSSPISVSSTSKATVASSPPTTPHWSFFPVLVSPAPSAEGSKINAYSNPPSRASSPGTQSFHSTLSSFCDTASEHNPVSPSRSSAPSPASSAYPSPPASPEPSRRSSSSGEEFMYPSPPPSPRTSQGQRPQIQHRERRAFTFPPPPSGLPTPPASSIRLSRSTSLSSHPYIESILELDAREFDLGEQNLGGGSIAENNEYGFDWSMNGGEVVFGAAGIALSPRAMKGSCCACGGHGLGLYVIDEEADEDVKSAVE